MVTQVTPEVVEEVQAAPVVVVEVQAPVDHQQVPSAHDSLNADQK